MSRELVATQMHVDSADITAVVAYVEGRRLVVVSVYIPDLKSMQTKEKGREALTKDVVQREKLRGPHTEVVVAGDFNRHNP